MFLKIQKIWQSRECFSMEITIASLSRISSGCMYLIFSKSPVFIALSRPRNGHHLSKRIRDLFQRTSTLHSTLNNSNYFAILPRHLSYRHRCRNLAYSFFRYSKSTTIRHVRMHRQVRAFGIWFQNCKLFCYFRQR